MPEIELIYRTSKIMVVKISGQVYTFYKNPRGIDVISDTGCRFNEEFLS